MPRSLYRPVSLACSVAWLALTSSAWSQMPMTESNAAATEVDIAGILSELDPDVRVYIGHINTLANPFFEGRAPGTDGNRAAADYLEFWFRYFELAPAFPGDPAADAKDPANWTSYRQPFDMPSGMEATRQELSMSAGGDARTFESGVDFNAMGMGEGDATAPLSWVGYGLERGPGEFAAYDSFGDIDLTDRIAVILRFEPSDEEGLSRWTGGRRGWSNAAGLRDKMLATAQRGAAGIILVHPPNTHDHRTNDLLTADESVWGRVGVPVVHMTIPAADELLQQASGKSLNELKAMADEPDAKAFHLNDDAKVTIGTDLERKANPTDNVGAVLWGRGDLKDEWIIIGGHYDHVGYGYFGSRTGAAGTIHPGADDNASGTSGVLLLAQLLSDEYANMDASTDARSILFMGFSAEESGLNGSRHYTRNPTLDAEQINIMLNLDMIGRLRDDSLEVSGVGSAEGLEEMLHPIFDESGLDIFSQQTGQGPSDHASFYAVGIPVLFFFTGLHDEYHSPADVMSTINPVGAVRVVHLAKQVALMMATSAERLVYQKSDGRFSRSGLVEFMENKDEAASTATDPAQAVIGRPSVRLGIRPAYREDVDGVLVEGVSEETSAADAGIKAGDILIAWNGEKIDGVAGLMGHIRTAKPGDVVKMSIERDGESMEVPVTLKANSASP
ncbi:MAG: M28 family peptidase [Phycisphaerales bacterium]